MEITNSVILISLILSIFASIIVIFQLINSLLKIRAERKYFYDESKNLTYRLKSILQDCNVDNSEELYEFDLSLSSYFNDWNNDLLSLSNSIKSHSQPWYYPKDKNLDNVSNLLIWISIEFYHPNDEEDERIRIWSQNISDFNKKYFECFKDRNDSKIFPLMINS